MTGREDPRSRNSGADPDPDPEPPVSTASASGALPASSSPDLHRRNDNDDRDRDALELHEIETHEDDAESWSSGSISSGEYRVTTRRTISRSSQRTEPAPKLRTGVWGRVQRFWTRNVVMTVPQKNNRDHFALERTFLAYIRTSVMIAMQGVLVAQLFRLQHILVPDVELGYYQVGIPLSVTFHGIAMLVALLGAARFWKQQHAMALGTVYAGGWEVNTIALLLCSVILVTFILSILITVEIETHLS
ncbi:hypothetical protein ATEIFO6365_0009039900 [Aspergillus terreus]|uniref:DUF202 domain-containing protein n=1 Tax=Aspergillus terreus TaxID=33178 RepID=A0A5M3ZBT5_ASPTE|nr:hypothetical protein ATETN484_0011039400 [Aspergillus terreus]GFF19036.1 hypothetical protein ATEIFO6365_0009039900 [Aspergillus terreus]